MDYRAYKQIYADLLSEQGRDVLGSDTAKREALENKINEFLRLYPSVIPPDADPATPITRVSLRELTHRSLRTAVDILNDISTLLGMRETLSATEFRRQIVRAFTEPSRRMYVGIWLVVLSFILYFIDASS